MIYYLIFPKKIREVILGKNFEYFRIPIPDVSLKSRLESAMGDCLVVVSNDHSVEIYGKNKLFLNLFETYFGGSYEKIDSYLIMKGRFRYSILAKSITIIFLILLGVFPFLGGGIMLGVFVSYFFYHVFGLILIAIDLLNGDHEKKIIAGFIGEAEKN